MLLSIRSYLEDKMNLRVAVLSVLAKYEGKPVVSHAITQSVAESSESKSENEWNIKEWKSWGWSDEKITREIIGEIQHKVLCTLRGLRKVKYVLRIPIKRGAELKKQIKSTGLVFMDPKQLTTCSVSYKITEAGMKKLQKGEERKKRIRK